MRETDSRTRGYAIAALFGAIGGGLLVALATRAMPKMATGIMTGMMQSMMAQMKASGCNPSEM